jgi:hypothetical protein
MDDTTLVYGEPAEMIEALLMVASKTDLVMLV